MPGNRTQRLVPAAVPFQHRSEHAISMNAEPPAKESQARRRNGTATLSATTIAAWLSMNWTLSHLLQGEAQWGSIAEASKNGSSANGRAASSGSIRVCVCVYQSVKPPASCFQSSTPSQSRISGRCYHQPHEKRMRDRLGGLWAK